jgi:hypothetical protein
MPALPPLGENSDKCIWIDNFSIHTSAAVHPFVIAVSAGGGGWGVHISNTSIVSINFRANLFAQNAGNGISGLQISKTFWGSSMLSFLTSLTLLTILKIYFV